MMNLENLLDIVEVTNYGAVKERARMRLVPADAVGEGACFAKVGDLAAVGNIHLGDYGEHSANLRVADVMLREWGVSKAHFVRDAFQNMGVPEWVCLEDMILNGPFGEACWSEVMAPDCTLPEGNPIALTLRKNESIVPFGAVAIAFPGIAERISSLLGEDEFVAVFTSIHEVMIHTMDQILTVGVDAIKATAASMTEVVHPDEVLSTNVYRFALEEGWSVL